MIVFKFAIQAGSILKILWKNPATILMQSKDILIFCIRTGMRSVMWLLG